MFNKALFKQSAKANFTKWLFVTVPTCIMLAIVIIVLGNLGINDIRDSLKSVFVQADQEAYLKENSVDSYELYLTTMTNYDQTHSFANYLNMVTGNYDAKVAQFEMDNSRQPTKDEIDIIINEVAQEFSAYADLVQQEPEILKQLVTEILKLYSKDTSLKGEALYDEYFTMQVYQNAYQTEIIKDGVTQQQAADKAESAKEIALDAINKYKQDSTSQGYSYNRDNYLIIARNYVNSYMYDSVYNMQISAGETEQSANEYAVSVKVISNSAISTYQLWLNEYENDDPNNPITQEEISQAKVYACQSISDQIPEKVAVALEELGNMDIYGLIIGSIFYRIAGLLLPMVFVIMTANGLLAGQIDSGSMAYVLSTPIERRTVAVTQMMYLLFSLLSMFALLTCVSVVAVWVVGGNNFAINYGEILLFNLGAFLTMFAISGYCFMCSAIFNRTKYSLSIGGGLTIFSLVCTILGLFGSQVVPSAMRISAMNFFNYISIITLFDTVSILNGSLNYLWRFGVLILVGIITFIAGVFRFDRKDLPL